MIRQAHRRRVLSLNTIPQDSLIAEWKLEETSGTAFFDSVGTHNGSVSDASLYTTTGKVGNGFNFTGRNGIDVPGGAEFEIYDGANKPFSVSFWHLQPTGTGASLEFFLNLHVTGTKIFVVAISGNQLRSELYLQAGGILTSVVDSTSFDNSVKDVWRHIVFSFDPANAEHSMFYVNGVKASQTITGTVAPIKTGNTGLQIGKSDSGVLDEIKWYTKTLTQQEAQNIYNAEL